MWWFDSLSESEQKEKKTEEVFAGRESLSDQQLWERYFQPYGVEPETVSKVRAILAERLETDLSRICDTDDFSKNLAFFWEFDSLADVEIVQDFEEQFSIEISDGEAEAMKTLKDMVLKIHEKITKPAA